jgi:2-haloalkanoic acid dehalogenase type II
MKDSIMKPKWIAFDVYTTLVDREEGASIAFDKIAKKNGIKKDGYDLFEEWHNEVIRIYRSSKKFVSWKKSGRIAIKRLFKRYNVKGNVSDIEILYESFKDWKPYNDVKPILKKLKEYGYKLAAVTNMDTDLLQKTNIGIDFDLAVTSEMAKAYKPNPKIFKYAIKKMNCSKNDLLWVGTSPWADIQGAKIFGLRMVWINRKKIRERWMRLNPWDPLPDYEFEDLHGLLKLLTFSLNY